MTTEEILVARYGPLLTRPQVAGILDRSAEGLRLTERGDSDLGRKLRAARVKIGRRVHFRVASIASLLDDDASEARQSADGQRSSDTGGSHAR